MIAGNVHALKEVGNWDKCMITTIIVDEVGQTNL